PHLALTGPGLIGRALVPAMDHVRQDGLVRAHFRSEAARLLPMSADPEPRSADFEGTVRHASYPGGLWRHAVDVAGIEIFVDSATRHEAGTRLRVRVPGEALFVFPASGPEQQPRPAARSKINAAA